MRTVSDNVNKHLEVQQHSLERETVLCDGIEAVLPYQRHVAGSTLR